MSEPTWVLESEVFADGHAGLRAAIRARGGRIVDWRDSWLRGGATARGGVPPSLGEGAVVFHGSLANAARVGEELGWTPGGFYVPGAFRCSRYYPSAAPWLAQRAWTTSTVRELVADARSVAARVGARERLFVRPDSPLKPFSGRVLGVGAIDRPALDYGFYYDEDTLPVIVAAPLELGREFRFVVVDRTVVAGAAYLPDGRRADASSVDPGARRLAAEVAASLPPPAPAYVLDVCARGDDYRLLELNPFGGADLYGCAPEAIVAAIARLLT